MVNVSRGFAAVAAGFLLAGCGIEAAFDDFVAGVQAELLQGVIDGAKANDGDAVVFSPADGADLAISEGPIAGARVVIPANALPAGVTSAVLAIYHDASYAVPGTEQVGAGPAVQVTLQSVPSLETIASLTTDATVTAPYGDAVSTETDEADVALGHDVGGTLEVIDGETDTEAGLVSGGTTTFSPFLAVLPAPVIDETPEPVVFAYTVTDTGGVLCEGSLLEAAVSATFESTIQSAGISDTWLDIWLDDTAGTSFNLSGGWFSAPVLLNGPTALTEATSWNVDVVNCGGNDYMFDAIAVTGTMSNWSESSALQQTDCGQTDDQSCLRHVGAADASIATDAVVNTTQDVYLTIQFDGEVLGSVEEQNTL
jgi:hypothetical protein